mmetsp:Transcript_1947/g.5906  ORF Transcript_1947/g.5906 Transcript_1947/m.5906 type:complete len:206 (+) Transcript_1947:1773-2390(+)
MSSSSSMTSAGFVTGSSLDLVAGCCCAAPTYSRGGMESSESARPGAAAGALSRFSGLMETFSPASSCTGRRPLAAPAKLRIVPLRPFSSAFERPRSTTASPSLKLNALPPELPTYSNGGMSSSSSSSSFAGGPGGGAGSAGLVGTLRRLLGFNNIVWPDVSSLTATRPAAAPAGGGTTVASWPLSSALLRPCRITLSPTEGEPLP